MTISFKTHAVLLPRRSSWGRFHLPLLLALAYLAVSGLTRLALVVTSLKLIDRGPLDLLSIFALGTAFDLLAAICLALPLVLYLTVLPLRVLRSRFHRGVLNLGTFVACSLILLVAVAEWLFWGEFQVRFNFVAVDYLAYTHEVLGNIDQSYPVPWILSAIAALSLALTWWLRKTAWASSYQNCKLPLSQRFAWCLVWISLVVVIVTTTVNNSGPHLSNNYNHELSRNGVFSFVEAFSSNEIDYETFYLTLDNQQAFQRIRAIVGCKAQIKAETVPENINRFVSNPGTERQLNVIEITVESLSARYLGVFGNTLGLTPELDELSSQSLFFTHCYATGTRTVRGMEALTLSVPPTPGRSIVKRPHNENLFNIGRLLEDHGYDSVFLYGGHGFFDNMNNFFEHNGFRIVDRGEKPDSAETFGTIWGACDEDLFNWTLEEADKAYAKKQPFFHFVMTTSNHRPYLFPRGKIENEQGRRSSAIRYTDFAIGKFLREAQLKPWFKDTIFVIVADHCASSAGRAGLPVENYEIPLILYAPDILKPRRIETLCSQIDVAPTILGILNLSYESEFYGRDIINMDAEDGRALIGNHQKLGLLGLDSLITLEPHQVVHNYRVAEDRSLTEIAIDPEARDDAIAYFQTAFLRFREHRRSFE